MGNATYKALTLAIGIQLVRVLIPLAALFAPPSFAQDLNITVKADSHADCAATCENITGFPRCEHAFFKDSVCVVTDRPLPERANRQFDVYSNRLNRWLTEREIADAISVSKVPAQGPPELNRIFTSTPSFIGDVNFAAGYYGTPEKTITYETPYFNGVLGAWIVKGKWGRKSSSKSGPIEFRFYTPCSFKGYWWYDGASKPSTYNWLGNCK